MTYEKEIRHQTRGWFCAALVLVAVLTFLTPMSATADGLSLEDIARFSYVSEIAMSPDGSQVAYTRTVQRNPFDDKNGSAWKELYLVDREGNSRPYVTGAVTISRPGWTPDGEMVTFLAERNDDTVKVLYGIPVDGGEAVTLVRFVTSVREYSWSPDGKQIAFLAPTPRTPDEEIFASAVLIRKS